MARRSESRIYPSFAEHRVSSRFPKGAGSRGGRRRRPLPQKNLSSMFVVARKTLALRSPNFPPPSAMPFAARIPWENDSPTPSAAAADCNTARWTLRCCCATGLGGCTDLRKFSLLECLHEAFAAGVVKRLTGRLMLASMPYLSIAITYAGLTCGSPRSEWCTKQLAAAGLRLHARAQSPQPR